MVSWMLPGATAAPSGADDSALLGAMFDVAYSVCTGNTATSAPSASGCGTSWKTLTTEQTVNARGVGSASVSLPASAVGSVVFRVQGAAQGSSSGCLFYALMSPRTVTLGTGSGVAVASSFPINGDSSVPSSTALLTITFSGNVHLNQSGAVATLLASGTTVATCISRRALLSAVKTAVQTVVGLPAALTTQSDVTGVRLGRDF